MATEQKITYCRICEALCGMVATVEDGKLVQLRPDRDNPASEGFACPKGIAMTEVHNDPDRVTHPLKRTPDGSFERVGWDEALDDIAGRLRAIRSTDGGEAVGWYMGNPAAFSYSHPLWAKGFIDALGSKHFYTASSQDVSNRFAASSLLYGSPFLVAIPDLARTEMLVMFGANPFVSHGSLVTAPRIKDKLHAITDRGGRVVVVDPRRTETARAFEHVAIHPDADAWLLLALLHVIFAEGLEDAEALEAQARGGERMRELAARFSPDDVADRVGIGAEEIRALARDIAAAPSAAIYGRTGSCLGRSGTLVSYLLDALSIATGNHDRPGGLIFGTPPIPYDKIIDLAGLGTYAKHRSRVGDLPEVLGSMPASLMAKEITTPGPGQMKAMFVSAGNPVLSCPNGEELEAAMEQLELCVAIDFYVSDTAKHADYVLPATTMYEREDFPLPFGSLHVEPYVQATEAVVEPAGEARQEWEIIEELARRLGIVPMSIGLARAAGKLGVRPSPKTLVDTGLRAGPVGDLFGLRRGGLSWSKLVEREPHGRKLAEHHPTGVLKKIIRHSDDKVHLDEDEIYAEAEALAQRPQRSDEFPLYLIGMRELRSHNSWMHNSPKLMAGERRHAARVHPDDAAELGIAEDDEVRITSPHGQIELAATVTDEIKPGTVAVPHGWGHRGGGWQRANAAGGANVNQLASSDPGDLERLAGMAHLNGIPVRLEAVAASAPQRDAALASAR